MPIARGSVLGFLIGIIPGSAHIISSFMSYALENASPKHPEEFGKGAVAASPARNPPTTPPPPERLCRCWPWPSAPGR
jgi:TctA family transporter